MAFSASARRGGEVGLGLPLLRVARRKLGHLELGLKLAHLRLGAREAGAVLIVARLGDEPLGEELTAARGRLAREGKIGLGLLQRGADHRDLILAAAGGEVREVCLGRHDPGLRRRDERAVLGLVEREEHLTLFDHSALGDFEPRHDPRCGRRNVDVAGFDIAVPLRHRRLPEAGQDGRDEAHDEGEELVHVALPAAGRKRWRMVNAVSRPKRTRIGRLYQDGKAST
jgi:hypothetical protein